MLLLSQARNQIRLLQITLVRKGSSRRSNAVSDKIQVQLLKDHPKLGARGEIVRVKPAFMRNYLHIGNGACYITESHGPRIPVVEKARPEPELVSETVETNSQKSSDSPTEDRKGHAMSLNELSDLFSSMRLKGKNSLSKGTRNSEQTFEVTSENIEYTASDVDSALPPILTLSTGDSLVIPINKNVLSSFIYEVAGVRLTREMIKLSEGDTANVIDEIRAVGNYRLSIKVPGEKNFIHKSLIVN